jgi:glycerophosphoryl diester phosphodiesterase
LQEEIPLVQGLEVELQNLSAQIFKELHDEIERGQALEESVKKEKDLNPQIRAEWAQEKEMKQKEKLWW